MDPAEALPILGKPLKNQDLPAYGRTHRENCPVLNGLQPTYDEAYIIYDQTHAVYGRTHACSSSAELN